MIPSGVLNSEFPLPEGWSPQARVQDVVDADGLRLHRVGLCARSGSDQALGSAADSEASPVARSTFELLERIAVLEAARSSQATFPIRDMLGRPSGEIERARAFPVSDDPERWAYARSNGVALHKDWALACITAFQELIERDRIQRAWRGETVPLAIPLDLDTLPLSKTHSYEWSTYRFPPPLEVCFGEGVDVVGIFGFPRHREAPLLFGFGARPSRAESLVAAAREALQLLAFLWGEPIPAQPPEPLPVPMTHLETFQYPGRHAGLRQWRELGHARYRGPEIVRAAGGAVRFIDITPPWLAHAGYCVAKAQCDAALALTFGLSPVFRHLPQELRIHPIP